MSTRKTDKYEGRYASRTKVMRSSAMRDLMSLTARPEVISLAGGLPATDSFPQDVFERINQEISDTQRALSLQYGPTEGFDFLKEDIALVMDAEGTTVDPAHVMITTGGQQAIDLVTKTFIDPGDIVVAEGPAYAGALTTFSTYQADVRHIPMDAGGLVVDELEALLDRLETDGRRPKFLYTVPNFSNPGGTTLTLERRRRLTQVAAERELLVVEDNPYGLLRYEGEPLPTLLSLDTAGNVVYLGSFSKIISPGIRSGWIVAPQAIYQKIVFGKQATDLCSSPFNQLFVHGLIASGVWREYITRLCDIYRSRRDAMLKALKSEFPSEATWTRPEGGFFVWATIPGIHTGDLLAKAIDENVAFVRGDAFYQDGSGTDSMRLSFSFVNEERIKEGVRRLGAVISDQMELYRALGL
ncbi:MAG: PLP-dependent aminotransferase family protein [Actinobacteria bacterium]|nr:PLP-dependent aminotransferase family protein [Actinomycetota bacterium]